MQRIRVLLVGSNNCHDTHAIFCAPYGLEVLRSCISSDMADIRIVSPFIFFDQYEQVFHQILRSFRPNIVGLSIRNIDNCLTTCSDPKDHEHTEQVDTFSYLAFFRRLLASGKELMSDCFIVLGGAGFSGCPESVLNYLGLNVGIVGPGEIALRKIIEHMYKHANSIPSDDLLLEFPGTIVRNPDGAFAYSRNRRDIPPFPPVMREENYVEYLRKTQGRLAVRTRIGCWLKCWHCLEQRRNLQPIQIPMQYVIPEIIDCVEKYNIREIDFADSEVNVPNEIGFLRILDQLIAAGLNNVIHFSAYFSCRHFSPELARALSKFRCNVFLTVDSLADRMLALIRKDYRQNDVVRTITLCSEYGLSHGASIIFGWPHETISDIQSAIEAMKTLSTDQNCRWSYSPGVRVYPGTRLADYIEKNHLTEYLYGNVTSNFLEPVVYSEAMPPRQLSRYLEIAFLDSATIRRMSETSGNRNDLLFLADRVIAVETLRY